MTGPRAATGASGATIPAGVGDRSLSWVEVSRGAFQANLRSFSERLSPGARLGVVLKSDAYGHGLRQLAPIAAQAGVDWLIVNSAPEAEVIREVGVSLPIYICGPVSPAQADSVVATGARLVVYDLDLVRALSAAARRGATPQIPVRLHLKVETGNHRQGLTVGECLALGREIVALQGVALEGLATHYADIEDTTDHGFAMGQLAALQQAQKAFEAAGMPVEMAHSANSAATILWPKTHGELVRVGISAYGLWPSKETFAVSLALRGQDARGEPAVTEASGPPAVPGPIIPTLQPVMAWRARVAQVKTVPAGGWIGYGRTFRATRAMRVAVVPVGYFEGYDRRLSNLGHGLLRGQRVQVRGRVCMNMTVFDVTDVPGAAAGDVITLLGQDGEQRVKAEELAGWMGGIAYEVVSRIHPGLPRIVVD